MNLFSRATVLAALGIAVVSAQAEPVQIPCRDSDAACIAAKRLASPVRTTRFWRNALAKPVRERYGVAPEELLVFLNLDNRFAGFPQRPRMAKPDAAMFADIRAAIGSIPTPVWRLVEGKLAGIYFAEDLGGTAMCDYVKGGWFSKDGGFIVLDVGVLAKFKANEWSTWKENTPFIANARFRLEATIEPESGNTRANAIRYILLHELGHVVSVGTNIHPVWDEPPPAASGFQKDYSFAGLSWLPKPDRSGYLSRFDGEFKLRKNVVYYFGAQMHAERMAQVYAALAKTNFPSLYAATTPGDDFAESFASYVHTVLANRPWEILLSKEGTETARIGACWNEPRCAEKRKFLDALFAK